MVEGKIMQERCCTYDSSALSAELEEGGSWVWSSELL